MEAAAIGLSHGHVDPRQLPELRENPPSKRETPARQALPAPDDASAPIATQAEKTEGVIGLIESGHFRGVADVRLRINFFDELTVRSAAAAMTTANEQVGPLVENVMAKATELFEPLLHDPTATENLSDALVEFESAIASALQGASNENFNADQLANQLTGAFNSFVEKISALAPAPAGDASDLADPEVAQPYMNPVAGTDPLPEVTAPLIATAGSAEPEEPFLPSPAEPTEPAADAETPMASPFDEALATLRATFEGALALLQEAMETSSLLPPISPAPGNGAAYSKFLDIYNSLSGGLRLDDIV